MLEAKGNIWDMRGDVLCITTNGTVKNNGEAVMGRGVALQAKQYKPDVAKYLGSSIRKWGNHVRVIDKLSPSGRWLVSFPVKHNWWEIADIDLIERSAHELVALVDGQDLADYWQEVLLPRPGCGNGQLSWDEVGPVLADVLDDRFIAVTYDYA